MQKKLDELIGFAERSASESQTALMKKMSNFVNSRQSLIYRLGGLRPELGWVRNFVSKQPAVISPDEFDPPNTSPSVFTLPDKMRAPEIWQLSQPNWQATVLRPLGAVYAKATE